MSLAPTAADPSGPHDSGTTQLSVQKGSRALVVPVTPGADVSTGPSVSRALELCINSPEPVFQNHCLSGEQREITDVKS